MPYSVYLFVLLKGVLHMFIFFSYVRDSGEPLFGEQNVKRFVVYNVLGDVLGLNATSGPLGFRMKYVFVTWWNMVMCPSNASVNRTLGRKHSLAIRRIFSDPLPHILFPPIIIIHPSLVPRLLPAHCAAH